MSTVPKGLLAGLAATVVLSVLMVVKTIMGVMPALDLPQMLAGMMGAPGLPLVGWMVHFVIGIIGYGLAIAAIGHRLSDKPVLGGVYLALAGWLLMVVVLMPMAGAGLFGIALGLMAPVMTLVLHLIFGAVLGATYGKLVDRGAGDPYGRGLHARR